MPRGNAPTRRSGCLQKDRSLDKIETKARLFLPWRKHQARGEIWRAIPADRGRGISHRRCARGWRRGGKGICWAQSPVCRGGGGNLRAKYAGRYAGTRTDILHRAGSVSPLDSRDRRRAPCSCACFPTGKVMEAHKDILGKGAAGLAARLCFCVQRCAALRFLDKAWAGRFYSLQASRTDKKNE